MRRKRGRGRRKRREEAREVAKLLMQQQPEKFRWDISFACLAAMMGIVLVIAPPQSRPMMLVCLAVMFGFGMYPAFHFAQWFPIANKRFTQAIGVAALAATICGLGYFRWPPIHRHTLDEGEKLSFENAIKPQHGSDLEVQIGCPAGDEKVCIYAEQFISLFGESGWKVNPLVNRVTLSRATDGVTVYRRGGNKEDMMKRWDSGGWFNLNEPHLLAIQSAFRAIHIEIDGGTNPDLDENVVTIYIGPEKDNEAKPTPLTKETAWATGKIKGPFPNPQ